MTTADIATERLQLRAALPRDAAAFSRLANDLRVVGNFTRMRFPFDLSAAASCLADVPDDARLWCVCRDGDMIGMVRLDRLLSYWIAPAFAGAGFATEAARAVSNWAFENGHTAVRAGHLVDNRGSETVLRRLGFGTDGFVRSSIRATGETRLFRRRILHRRAWQASRDTVISTPRPTLSNLRMADIPAMVAAGGAFAGARAARPLPCPVTRDDVRRRIMSRRFFGRAGFSLAIRRDGQIIGEIGLDGASAVSLSFWLTAPQRRRGVATEAIGQFLTHMMPRLQLPSVTADICADTQVSARTLEKLGVTGVGNLRCAASGRNGLSRTREFRLTGLPVSAKRHGL